MHKGMLRETKTAFMIQFVSQIQETQGRPLFTQPIIPCFLIPINAPGFRETAGQPLSKSKNPSFCSIRIIFSR